MVRLKKDFYEIQSLQWRKSLFVFTVLIFFDFVAVGLISLAVVLSLGFFGRLFNSHPPLLKRIDALAGMAGKKPDRIIRDVWEGRQNREKAREFPRVRLALRDAGRKRPVDPDHGHKCPRCRVPLAETFYEGVAIKLCPRCQGKFIDEGMMDRVIARKEAGFSEGLVRKAMEFKERFFSQPVKTRKISETQPIGHESEFRVSSEVGVIA